MNTRLAFDAVDPDFGEITFNKLVGWLVARTLSRLQTPNDPLVLPEGFHDWVAYRLHYYETTMGFRRMILGRVDDNNAAKILLFDLLDEFHCRKERIVATHQEFKIVTYSDDPGFFVLPHDTMAIARRSFCPTIQSLEFKFRIKRKDLTIMDTKWELADLLKGNGRTNG